jgi:hypothetical protein
MVFFTLIIAACTTTTEPDPYVPPEPQEPDSAWKVIWNLEIAYEGRDLDEYMSCFREDFIFHLSPHSSQPPDTTWGFAIEMGFHQPMFNYVDSIDLEFTGDTEYTWEGDSTGESLRLDRSFYLKVYYTVPGSPFEGSKASGTAMFICRPDSNGDWYVWQWADLSETKQGLERMTWTEIKALF